MLLVDFKGHSGWSESVDGVDGGPLICKDGLDEEFTGELGFAVVGGRTKATLPVPAGLGRGDCAAPVDAAFTATRPLAPHALARPRVGLTLKGRSSFDLSQSGWDGKMSARYLLRIVLVRVR